jgi:hypothetical protein
MSQLTSVIIDHGPVSKIRVTRLLDCPLLPLDAVTQSFFYSLKLLGGCPLTDQNFLYETLKQVLSILEGRGELSIHLITVCALVATYEMAQGLYPSAYLSIGNCVRIGFILGLHDKRKATQLLPRAGMTTTGWHNTGK